ncbi:MAG: hypothetical protein M1817_006842 [Caeruleum heppii]|nr:MAG: hypothetical protein M1817_006842 [Caeruleum heppii]
MKCVHKGCGKTYTDPDEECVYHPGPPEFHEGQKGWKCCKPRFLTFDEFLAIPPCTTGKHSTVDDTPVPVPTTAAPEVDDLPKVKPISNGPVAPAPVRAQERAPILPSNSQAAPTPRPEPESDDPSLPIPADARCRRRGCDGTYNADGNRQDEQCIFHPGQAIFHEGTKGYTCCKRRVLEFDDFMRLEGCTKKSRHLFVGSGRGKDGKGAGEERLETVRHDFYQTGQTVIVSLYLKKIDKENAKVRFASPTTVELDLPTTDKKRYKTTVPLYGSIDPEQSAFQIMGTKLELTLAKADGTGWPVLRSDSRHTGEIIQTGRAGRA